MQEIEDGDYIILTPEGERADNGPTVFTMYRILHVHIHGDTHPLAEYLDKEYTFIPLVQAPPPAQAPEALRYILWRYGQDHTGEDHQERLRVASEWLASLAQQPPQKSA